MADKVADSAAAAASVEATKGDAKGDGKDVVAPPTPPARGGKAYEREAAKGTGKDGASGGGGGGGGSGGDGAPAPAAADGDDADLSKESVDKHPFFHYYGMLVHQQNMLQDSVRTGTYYNAITGNASDFRGKVVLDVGTGTGILAYFAAKAGARKVYAVEASGMADSAKKLMEANGFGDRVIVLKGKVEEVEIPDKVDVIISEPMGFLLVHERMLESYIAARQRFLRPGGLMMPTNGTIFAAPFTDATLYHEQASKVDFWKGKDFYGLDLSCLVDTATRDHFSQPVVGYFNPSILLAEPTSVYRIDFSRDTPESLHTIDIPFHFEAKATGLVHGLACWFDVLFMGTTSVVRLDTGPSAPGTHWYQCRLLLREPIAVNKTQGISGTLNMVANKKYSYTITLTLTLDGTKISATNVLNLHDQMYHYMSSADSASPAVAADPTASADGWGAY